MYHFKGSLLLIFLFSIVAEIKSTTTLYASSLGCAVTLSVADPTGTIVILDVDLIVSESCPLKLVGNAGNITFTATGSQRLIISPHAQWDVSSLQKPNSLNFNGNAHLVMSPGAQILADQSTGLFINFEDQSLLSVVPS